MSFHAYAQTDSLFRTELPSSSAHDRSYELGSEFRTLSDGYITKARLYTRVNEGGDHIVRLWVLNGSVYSLAAGPYTWNFPTGVQGWRSYTFPAPVAVNANRNYIISISNSTDHYYVIGGTPASATNGVYIRYLRGVYSTTLGSVPKNTASCYFRDVVFAISGAETITPGTIGAAQIICYNSAPAALIQLTAPAGGTGSYTYQWQSSPDNNVWTDIPLATLAGYAPPVLTSNTYFRRTVICGSLDPVHTNSVLISVSPQITLAQLHDNITIDNNTSANFNVAVTGGTSPFTINYTRNGVAQTAITNYISGTNISTGTLTTGTYTYALTSVTDAGVCPAQNTGTGIIITVSAARLYIPVDSLFRTELPSSAARDRSYELGSEFRTLSDGYITKARLYTRVNEGGDHIVRLWVLNGSVYTLAAGPYTWNFPTGVQGWRSFTFPVPVAVNANRTYIISISNSTDHYYVIGGTPASATNGVYIRYLRGVYSTTLGSVPTNSNTNCYFRDVVFAISGAETITPGTIGAAQTICYNSAPAALIQLTAPSGEQVVTPISGKALLITTSGQIFRRLPLRVMLRRF